MSVNFGSCSGFGMVDYEVTSRFPVAFTKVQVTRTDANGNPLEVIYYYNGHVVFTTLQTWNAQSKETSFEVFQP